MRYFCAPTRPRLHRCARCLRRAAPRTFGCESRETPDSKTTDRLIAGVSKEVDSNQVVAVELFMIRALLFADVDRTANRYHPHEILERAGDRDADRIAGAAWHVGVVSGSGVARRRSALEHVKIRNAFPAIARSQYEAEPFTDAGAFYRRAAGKDYGAFDNAACNLRKPSGMPRLRMAPGAYMPHP